MNKVNYILVATVIIGGLISMYPKHKKLGLNFIKCGIIGYILIYLAPIIYSYIDKLVP